MPTYDYRDYLKEVWTDKKRKNPAFSLRGFANGLGIAPSMLSSVLRGERNLSRDKAFQIGNKLGWESEQVEAFCLMVDLEKAKDPDLKLSLLERIKEIKGFEKVRNLELSLFKTISEWYHFALLEMTFIKNQDFSIECLSKRLGLTPYEIELALKRLIELDLIEKVGDRYLKKSGRLQVKSDIPNLALRKYHYEMLTKAQQALKEQGPEEKYIGSETMSFGQSKLDEAKKIIRDCKTSLLKLAAKDPELNDEIYHLGIQFFRLTQQERPKKIRRES